MNFKVKCVGYNARERYFTLGKIYDVKDGQIFCDDGGKYKSWSDFGESFENLYKWFKPWYEFELVKDEPKCKFKVGDKIKAIGKNSGYVYTTAKQHWEGVVAAISTWSTNEILVRTTKCDTPVTSEYWVNVDYFELIEEHSPEIHITVKGNETIAVYKNGTEYKKAVAKCSPEDTFDFGVGAKLALERLGVLPADPVEKKDEPKYFTGKAVFVQNRYDDAFTIGKVYEFVNGKTVDDNGHIRPSVTTGNRVTVGDKYLNLTAADEWVFKFLPLVD